MCIRDRISKGDRVLAEGAQGSMLDVDFGTFPFVTSSNTISAGVCTGLGVPPQKIRDVIGVTKAYCTRVGGGPFPTELHDETGERLRAAGHEYGATTGRPRRCGWLDLVALRYACMINGVTQLVVTKSDVLDGFATLAACEAYCIDGKDSTEVPYQLSRKPVEPRYRYFDGWMTDTTQCSDYGQFPSRMKEYITYMGQSLSTRISFVSNGPGRDQLISRHLGCPRHLPGRVLLGWAALAQPPHARPVLSSERN